MEFIKNAEAISRESMNKVNPTLVSQFTSVIRFLACHPDKASASRGGRSAPPIGSKEYIHRQAEVFSRARNPRAPQKPATIPDEMVSVILVSYFGICQSAVERIKREHQLSMGAENMVGELLERYLASVLEPQGWIWCSGSIVKAIDFIKPPATAKNDWQLLQVKNRDNSENSSSSTIRDGTNIKKWYRTFSRTGGLNWEAFPDDLLKAQLSENAFKAFVCEYLTKLR
ncbi:hypothetical protein FACS189488_01960 [Betaproteobacteria bacterium]|nr:hypothetical protein FACS189488_01960 [Betaproteobacteria bacterium]